jgi:hypothetical protein
MQSTSTIYRASFFLICTILITSVSAQENSPYSRYGLGDFTYSQHIATKGMGGVAVAYADGQIVNFSNPASYANLKIVTYDLGVTIDSRTLRSSNPVSKYSSTNFSPSYLSVGFPIDKMKNIGASFGFRPITRINYSVVKSERLSNLSSNDSVQTGYEGTGGLNQFYFGLGKKWKNGFSIGFNSGYNFGKRESNAKRAFINDTVAFYKSNYSTTTSFGGMFFLGGFQFETLLDSSKGYHKGMKDKYYLRLGGTVSLGQKLNASQNISKETFEYDNSGGIFKVDSIFASNNNKGTIHIPATYTAGFLIQKTASDASGAYDIWSFGADFTTAKWSEYRFYNMADALINTWQVRVGGAWVPDPKSYDNYFSRINYKAGFNFGKDYINADGKELKTYGVSFGLGLPVRPARFSYQFTTIHTAFEYGKRGSAVNNITENYFKLSFALSISDIWFIKRKYD